MSNYSGAKRKHENRSGLTRGLRRSCLALLVFVFLPGALGSAFAQDAVEGIDNGNYHYQGSFEFGYRFVNPNGSQAIYDTFVDERKARACSNRLSTCARSITRAAYLMICFSRVSDG